ncbi:Lrp/AsnC family transcriptional regulator, partial [Rivihabitans pingtungensis]
MLEPHAQTLNPLDQAIIDRLQGDFPLCAYPYDEAAAPLGIDADTLMARLDTLLARRVLTRFGPMFQVERMGGAFVLAALAAPEARFAEVAEQVNA